MTAAPSGGKVAWLMKERGANNLWVAAAPDFKGRRLTSITEDDGQEIGEVAWTADGKSIVYVRGGDLETNGDNPNPESLVKTPEMAVWIIPFEGGAPKKLSEGRMPAVSKNGDVAFVRNGQIWLTNSRLENQATSRSRSSTPRDARRSCAGRPTGPRSRS